jgi:hypothetical protein
MAERVPELRVQFTKKGKLQPASILVEHIVGLFDRERSGTVAVLTAAEFNDLLNQMAGDIAGGDPACKPLTDAQLINVRNRIDELHRQWAAIPPDSTMELTFDRAMESRRAFAITPFHTGEA